MPSAQRCPFGGLFFWGTLLAALSLVCPASAFERQWHAGVDLGLAHLSRPAPEGVAPGADRGAFVLSNSDLLYGGHVAYGLSDTFNAMLDVGFSYHRGPLSKLFGYGDENRHVGVMSTSLGVAYTFDVLQWVPYAGVAASMHRFVTSTSASNAFGPHFVLGLDYEVSRDWALGFTLQYDWLLLKPQALDGTSYGVTALRGERLWGF